jgi:hypothetical protein
MQKLMRQSCRSQEVIRRLYPLPIHRCKIRLGRQLLERILEAFQHFVFQIE